jgi:hypothetical protein
MSRGAEPATDHGEGPPDREALLARIETLEGEVDRLETDLADARRTSYRRTALGMAVLGGLALAGAAALPGVRTVLVALGATGLFGALLTHYLTPERFVGASVAGGVYGSLAANLEAIAAELELADAAVYVPVDGEPPARLYVPEQPPGVAGVPAAEDLRNAFVVTAEHRGLSVRPTGGPLRAVFVDATAPVPDTPGELARAAAEALVEQFELVDAADPDVGDRRVSVRVTGSTYGPVDRLDHPVASFLATTVATALDRPVDLEVTADAADGSYLVTCRWDVFEDGSERAER